MELKHTPGPWACSHRLIFATGMYSTQVYDNNGETIASIAWYPIKNGNVTSTNRDDNARLIAAAPAMLDMLIECYQFADATGRFEMAKDVKEIIEKATGLSIDDILK